MTGNQVEEVVSPCIGVCSINEVTGFCNGCYRTIEEIQGWWDLSAIERSQVMVALDARQSESLDFGD